jgi:hypothetical protein
MMGMPMNIYEPSVVAFIDILGFKNALKDSSKVSEILDTLSHVKKWIGEKYSDSARDQFQGVFDIELTAFSDSVVISGGESQAVIVVLAALELSQLLIEKGFLCRGAIVCGELYHKEGIVFGNGLVDAFKTETSQAIYPRILLDQRIAELLNESKNDPNDFQGLIVSDKDSSVFLNLLYEDISTTRNIKSALCSLVKGGLKRNSDNQCIKQKLMWVNNEYCS